MTHEPTPQEIEMMDEAHRLEQAEAEREANNALRKGPWNRPPRECLVTFSQAFRIIPEIHRNEIINAIRHYDDEDPNDPYRLNDYGQIKYTGPGGFGITIVWKIDKERQGRKTFRILTIMTESDMERFFS